MPLHVRPVVLMLAFTAGVGPALTAQEPGKEKKEKKDKEKKEKKGPEGEEERLFKTAEKAFQPETERAKWVKEMGKRYPGSTAVGPDGGNDYGKWFAALTDNRDAWSREAAKGPVGELFDRAASRVGAAGGTLTRDQFLAYAHKFLGPTDSPLWKLPDPDKGPKDPLDESDKMFRDQDRNGNGVLDPDEQSAGLRAANADRNRDGWIDPAEYRAYVAGRLAVYRDNPELFLAPPSKADRPPESAPEPMPARAAVPRPETTDGLPAWFRGLDADGDGQVGLYEWRKTGGRSAAEFVALDENGDGLLTADELQRFLRANPASPYAAAALPPVKR